MCTHSRNRSGGFFHDSHRLADDDRSLDFYRLTLTEEEGNDRAQGAEGAGKDERLVETAGQGVDHFGCPTHDKAADPPCGEEHAVIEAVVLEAPEVLGERREQAEIGAVIEADEGSQNNEKGAAARAD